MNGAPAKPISGTSPSSATSCAPPRRRAQPLGLKGFHPGDICGGADRVLDDRPDVGHDVQVDARCPQRHDDVGEQDGRVDAVPAHRLQRDLGDQLGVEAGLHHRVLRAQRPVLGQRTPRLPHEPHRNPARLTATGSGQIRRLRQLTTVIHRHQCCHDARTVGRLASTCSAIRRACAQTWPDGLPSRR